MNVNTIIVSQEEALRKLDQYKNIVGKKRTKEDDQMQSVYASISKGARVVNIASAFKQTGLNDKLQPKLAIARADWPRVHCHRDGSRVIFTETGRLNHQAKTKNIALPFGSFDFPDWRNWSRAWYQIASAVPHIPPSSRPKYKLENYHILFEVENWEEYPVDPFLLRRIGGYLYVVEAEWELTPLEKSLLEGLTLGN